MKITSTPFDYTYHHSKKAGNHLHGFYVFHSVDIYNSIIIDDLEFQAVYQTGIYYLYNDYDCPCPEPALSETAGTDDFLLKINELYESDFDNNDLIVSALEEINELCPHINNIDKLVQIYNVLNDNRPMLTDFLDSKIYTDEIDDYIEDEVTGLLAPKIRKLDDK